MMRPFVPRGRGLSAIRKGGFSGLWKVALRRNRSLGARSTTCTARYRIMKMLPRGTDCDAWAVLP